MSEEGSPKKIRIDKWLWAIRLFKTRSLASEACTAGKVKIGSRTLKPGYIVKIGDCISVSQTPIIKTVRVLALLEKRVGAKLVSNYLEDLTPESEYEKRKLVAQAPHREKSSGRPSKKERREISKFF